MKIKIHKTHLHIIMWYIQVHFNQKWGRPLVVLIYRLVPIYRTTHMTGPIYKHTPHIDKCRTKKSIWIEKFTSTTLARIDKLYIHIQSVYKDCMCMQSIQCIKMHTVHYGIFTVHYSALHCITVYHSILTVHYSASQYIHSASQYITVYSQCITVYSQCITVHHTIKPVMICIK